MVFYVKLEVNDSAAKVLGIDTLRNIAIELHRMVKKIPTLTNWDY